jgi:uncharacterized protein involved in exopolysaccharide biosynthesis
MPMPQVKGDSERNEMKILQECQEICRSNGLEIPLSTIGHIRDDARADLLAENAQLRAREIEREREIGPLCDQVTATTARADKVEAQLKAEIFALTASQQICVGATGVGNFDEVCGWIDGMKDKLEAANARGDAALIDMERALARADKGRGST